MRIQNARHTFQVLMNEKAQNQIILVGRKYFPVAGDDLNILRKKKWRKDEWLGIFTVKTETKITIHPTEILNGETETYYSKQSLEIISKKEGFESWAEMKRYFNKKYVLPVNAVILTW